MLNNRCALDTTFKVSGAIILYIREGESGTHVKFCFINRLVCGCFLKMASIYIFMKPIYRLERIIVFYHFSSVQILMVHEPGRWDCKYRSNV